jgi:hypothetical protein
MATWGREGFGLGTRCWAAIVVVVALFGVWVKDGGRLWLRVCVFVAVVGGCVGLVPHISHCKCAPACTYVHTVHCVFVFVGAGCVVLYTHTSSSISSSGEKGLL